MADGTPRPSPVVPSPVVVVMGVAGSGKSTIGRALAERLGWSFVEGDDHHPAANVEKMRAGHPLDDDDRRPWLLELHRLITARQAAGTPTVLTCSALKDAYRRLLVGDLPGVVFVHLAASPEVLAARLQARRGHYMPASLLQSQLHDLEAPADALTVDVDAPVDEIIDRVRAGLAGRGVTPPPGLTDP